MSSRSFLLVLFCALPVIAGVPSSPAETEAQLGRVQARIRAVTEAVQTDVAARDAVAAQLQKADRALAGAKTRFEEARDRHAQSVARLASLREEAARARVALEGIRSALAAQLRNAYMSGRDEALKALLSTGDPAQIPRMLAYYGYVGQARSAQITSLDERARALVSAEAAVATETSRLAELEVSRQKEATALERARRDRAQALGQLQARIAKGSGELKELKGNAAALEELLKRLRAALAEPGGDDFGALGQGKRPFRELRGKLPWPARGSLAARFGDNRVGGLTWNGVLLNTRRAAEVRAPYFGRVAYADWLPGLGLLLVIDHGAGWMTLYGYNGRLMRNVGDRVKPGDVIAETPGDPESGKPQLYFEIRESTRAIDPRLFLKGAPTP
jgi:septal ring factor EnvC (AmiA/AmiB activator)